MRIAAEFESFLRDAISSPSRPVVWFAGAGVSVSSGLPDFLRFSAHVIRCVTGLLERGGSVVRASVLGGDEVDLLASHLRPEVLLQVLYEQFEQGVFDFYEWLDVRTPNPSHEFLARAMRAGHCVFTTNVDRLIETAYVDLYGEAPRVCAQKEEFAEFLRQEPLDGRRLFQPGWVLKVHGSLGAEASDRSERYGSIQFALNQVSQGLSPKKARVLERCFGTTDFCFLGYSGCDHFSVQPILRNTLTQGTVYWLWHQRREPTLQGEGEAAAFASDQVRTIADLAGSGKSYAEIAQLAEDGRGWELLSVCEILARQPRAVRWAGDVSELLGRIVQRTSFARIPPQPCPFPQWLADVSSCEQHLAAARLLRRAIQLESAERHSRESLHLAGNRRQVADARRVLADILLVPSTADTDRRVERELHEALRGYESENLVEQVVETRLELVNIQRRMKKYPTALDSLRETELLLSKIDSPERRNRLAARLHLQYGLVVGLSGSPQVGDQEAAIDRLSQAVHHAEEAGLIATKASALNSRGLVTYQLAGRSRQRLQQAEADLAAALEINTRIGDPRGCFQQCRNLGLIHAKLAELEVDDAFAQRQLDNALADYEAAERFLDQFPGGAREGEVCETWYRKGEILLRKADREAAEALLSKVQERRSRTGDWHNEARTLEVLLQTTQDAGVLKERLERILAIYDDVQRSPDKQAALAEYPIRRKNAVVILRTARETAAWCGLSELAEKVAALEQAFRLPEG